MDCLETPGQSLRVLRASAAPDRGALLEQTIRGGAAVAVAPSALPRRDGTKRRARVRGGSLALLFVVLLPTEQALNSLLGLARVDAAGEGGLGGAGASGAAS